jgi:hypothetical protein
VGAPEFSPTDVCGVKWGELNQQLADEDVEEWMDVDVGWTHTLVTIPVPFHP